MVRRHFSDIDIEAIIFMAWADTIPFETIELEYGLNQNQVQAFMRKHQSSNTYVRWRKRVEGRSGTKSKHALVTTKTSAKQKF